MNRVRRGSDVWVATLEGLRTEPVSDYATILVAPRGITTPAGCGKTRRSASCMSLSRVTRREHMRGGDQQPEAMFSDVSIEDRIPAEHPPRAMRTLVGCS